MSKKGRVIGIGGMFFKSSDPKATKEWYANNLGLVTDDYGSSFESRNANNPEEINYLQWSSFKSDTYYFKPSKKELMINYCVENLVELVEQLKSNDVIICDQIESFDYGKFIHILHADCNKIELWEPVDKVLTESLDGKTTK
jgi:predicted enzyme related to lactoylglutathione lyase